MEHVVLALITRLNSDKHKEYLLISSVKDFGEKTGFYYPPGGHLETGENEEEAIVRELKEELGLDIITIKKIAETPGDMPNLTAHWWQCEMVNPKQSFIVQSTEIADVRWFSEDEILEREDLWPATKQIFDSYIFGAGEDSAS